jgi:hypothetical protein
VQHLGRFDALPDSDAIILERAFWLGNNYFTLNEPFETVGPLVTDHGPAERLGRMALADGIFFYSTRVIARLGDLTVRMIDDGRLLIAAACYNFGNYVTDVADPTAEAPKVREVCQSMRSPDDVLYDGWRIAFQPGLTRLGPRETNIGLVSYALGQISIEHESDQTQSLPAEFLQDIELRVNGTLILPPNGAWDEKGMRVGTRFGCVSAFGENEPFAGATICTSPRRTRKNRCC